MTTSILNIPFLFLQEIGIKEILLIALVILLLFGGKKIPELMRGLGSGIREFKDAKDQPGAKKPAAENKE
ncbi:sec-independent protein translocase protein TatA [Chitinophaga jiangningensis]|uniref:Sec-independent protein translocase protein TatA n=1 Tax=Chitinophaga jiangningensis TaxID=1419482 RepID=A0A1M7HGU3_9BACT|nr:MULTISPECIES: twin-arginine translocase TatA/TatE family subunit [Chitinophaga]MBV7533455.1 twin-arginine translocase TatA/TatE family subunit [Chitinophaga sp. sic0106]SHM27702.1 sec-independent protein translocase protein TatA [Chitinophaga jiangningensis]